MMLDLWMPRHKGDVECRALTDNHYSRQNPGSPLFTRPGYNFVLFNPAGAVFVWWRPKWESGIERYDKMRVIECTMFRNTSSMLSSTLIIAAEEMLRTDSAKIALRLDAIDKRGVSLLTGVSSWQTTRRRSAHSIPGACFVHAGWRVIPNKKTAKADVWLKKQARYG